MTSSNDSYEFVTVKCLYCEAERTCGKRVSADLPEWVCGPCKREEAREGSEE